MKTLYTVYFTSEVPSAPTRRRAVVGMERILALAQLRAIGPGCCNTFVSSLVGNAVERCYVEVLGNMTFCSTTEGDTDLPFHFSCCVEVVGNTCFETTW